MVFAAIFYARVMKIPLRTYLATCEDLKASLQLTSFLTQLL